MEQYLIDYTNEDGENFDMIVSAADPKRAAYLYIELQPDVSAYRPDQLHFMAPKHLSRLQAQTTSGQARIFQLKPNGYEGGFIWGEPTEEFPKNHMLFVGSFAFA